VFAPPRNKFNAHPRTFQGEHFASSGELLRHFALLVDVEAGLKTELKRQVNIPIELGGVLIKTWRADWVYYDHQLKSEVVEDFKGWIDADFKFKLKMFWAVYPDRLVCLSFRNQKNWYLKSYKELLHRLKVHKSGD